MKIDRLWYGDLNYATVLEKHLCLEKDVDNIFRKINEVSVTCEMVL